MVNNPGDRKVRTSWHGRAGFVCLLETSQRQILRPLEPAPVSVRKSWHRDWALVAEYCAANCLVGRHQGLFVAAPSRVGQCFQHMIALLHSYCDIVAVLCESLLGCLASLLTLLASFRSGRPVSLVDVRGAREYQA